MYYYGKGVAKDEAEAVSWYRKAAEQGEADAVIQLSIVDDVKVWKAALKSKQQALERERKRKQAELEDLKSPERPGEEIPELKALQQEIEESIIFLEKEEAVLKADLSSAPGQ